ncbi:MAG: hypothetical protein KBD00_04515 [Candidatus Peribacteraceae bacterium]|nr:hypothetical protein [Candidatus Peribacteraceae bacterium]
MKYSHFFLGEREQRIIFFEAPKPAEVTPDVSKPIDGSGDPRAEGAKKITHVEETVNKATESLTKMSKIGEGTVLTPPPSSEATAKLGAAVKAKAEAARAKIPGEGTVLAPKLEKGGDTQDWAKSLSPAEKSHIENAAKDMTPDKKAEFNANMNTLSPENVKFMAVEGMAQEKFAKTLGPDLGRKVDQLQQDGKLTSKMMMDGLTPVEAAKLGLKPEEAATLKKAHAEMVATFQAAYPETGDTSESKTKSPEDEALMKKLIDERDNAKTNGARIQAEMKIVQQEMKYSDNKIGSIIQLAILAYALLQSIKDGSYSKVNIEATAAGSGEKAADIIAKSKNPEEARPKLVARREMNLQGMKQMDSENQANAKELAKLNKEIADKTRENGATPPPAEATKSINNQVIAANQERAKVIQEAMDANNETKKVMQEENKVIDAYLAGSPADKSSPDTKGAGEKPEAPPAAAPTVAPDMKPLTPAEVLNNSRTVDRAKEQVLSSFAAIKNAEPDFVNSLQGQISMKVDDSTGKINVSIQESALFAMNAMQQKYELPINPLAKKMEDPKPVVAVLQKIQKAINDKNEGAASTAPVYN